MLEKRKKGRPFGSKDSCKRKVKEVTKDSRITIRVTDQVKDQLVQFAIQNNTSLNALLEKEILKIIA